MQHPSPVRASGPGFEPDMASHSCAPGQTQLDSFNPSGMVSGMGFACDSGMLSPPLSGRSQQFDLHPYQQPPLQPLPATPVARFSHDGHSGQAQAYYSQGQAQVQAHRVQKFTPRIVYEDEEGNQCACAEHGSARAEGPPQFRSPFAQGAPVIHSGSYQKPHSHPHSHHHHLHHSPQAQHSWTNSPHELGGTPQSGLFDGLGDVFIAAPPPGKNRVRSMTAGTPVHGQPRTQPRRGSEQLVPAHHFSPSPVQRVYHQPQPQQQQAHMSSGLMPSGTFFSSPSASTTPIASPRKPSYGEAEAVAGPSTYATAPIPQSEWRSQVDHSLSSQVFQHSPLSSQFPAPASFQLDMHQDHNLDFTNVDLCNPFPGQLVLHQPQPMYPSPSQSPEHLANQPLHISPAVHFAPLPPAGSHRGSITSQVLSLGHPVVDLALRNRQLVPQAPPKADVRPKGGAKARTTSRLGKVSIALEVDCSACGVPVAGLVVRGKSDLEKATCEASYFCLGCRPLADSPAAAANEGPEGAANWMVNPAPRSPAAEDEPEATYMDSFSAALDRLSGVHVTDECNALPLSKSRAAVLGRKSRPQVSDTLTCDVCARDVGSGALRVTSAAGVVARPGVECVCASCDAKYQRCSDCGGGGGPRLGIGRWRSRELFVDGHLNCSLSHVRLGSLSEASYDVWRVDEIPAVDLDALLERCREIYCAATIANLAIPDVLEAPRPLARTFAEVQMLASDEFSVFEHLLRKAAAAQQASARPKFLALRWSTPTPRKRNSSASQATHAPADFGGPSGSKVFPQGKSLSSYIIGEFDLAAGSVGIPLMAPRGHGDAYDANTFLLQRLLARCHADRDAHARAGADVPELAEVWSFLPFKKESRVLNKPESRRGFVELGEYLRQHPAVDAARFPPSKQVLLPSEFMTGWKVWARRVRRGEELLPVAEPGKAGQRRKSESEAGTDDAAARAKRSRP